MLLLLLLICAIIMGLSVDYSNSAVGHIYAMWQVFYSGAYDSDVKCSIPVFLVTLLIAVISYKEYILTQLSCIFRVGVCMVAIKM